MMESFLSAVLIYRVPVEHRPSHMFGGSSCQDVTSRGGDGC